jgi:flagellar protein FliO/FliZ
VARAELAAPPKPTPRPEPAPAAKPAPEPETPSRVSDPFSVEEIEAEFARLLGRPVEKNEKG